MDKVSGAAGVRPSSLLGHAINAVDRFNAAAKILCGLLLAVATLSVFFQVLVRFVLDVAGLNVSAAWTEEVARYSFIWAVFIGVGVISRVAGLIAVEMLPQLLPAPFGKYVKLGAIAVTIAFFVLLLYVGSHFAIDGSFETSPVLRLKMSYIYAALPVGAFLAIVNLTILFIEGAFYSKDLLETDPELAVD